MKHSFDRSLIAAAALGVGVYVLGIRPWHLRWGANKDELNRALPGDDLVPEPKIRATHAITIRATPPAVWPWVAQLGLGRGGFYSYDWLENLMGLDIHSADRIIPELQNPQVGEAIPLGPGFGVPIAAIEPGRFLVLHGDTRSGHELAPRMRPGDYINTSWVFMLEAHGSGMTRLIERFQADYNPSAMNRVFYRALVEPGSFIMERKMLLGIKKRAEAQH